MLGRIVFFIFGKLRKKALLAVSFAGFEIAVRSPYGVIGNTTDWYACAL